MSLLDDVSIVITPNGYKARTLFGAIPVPTEGSDLVTGANSATTVAGTYTDVQTNYGGAIGDVLKVTFTLGGDYRLKISSWFNYFSINSDIEYNSGVNVAYIRVTGNNYGSGDLRFNNLQTSTVGGSISDITVKVYVSADMDVTRATAATRVDEAGLVNYAEILGSEEVTNGSFTGVSDGTDVITLSGWSAYNSPTSRNVVDNKLVIVQNGANQGATYNTGSLAGNYKLTVDVSGDTGLGGIYIGGTGLNVGVNTYLGKLVYYFTASSSLQIYFRAGNNSAGNTTSYTNISVKEVTRDNVPRIDYSGGGCPHILAEPQRTNLIPYSEDFSNAAWTKTRCTIDSGGHTSPSGESDAFKMTATDNDARLQDGSESVGVVYNQSIYVKSATGSDVSGQLDFTGTQIQTFTATSEWRRVDTTSDDTRAGVVRVRITNSGDELYIWGAQLEQGSYPTSMIPTSGSTVTRNQDIFTRDGISSLINSEEGVLFVEAATTFDSSTSRRITLSDGSTSNRVSLEFDDGVENKIKAFITLNGASQILEYTATDLSQFNKIAIKWKVNDFAMWFNGVEADTDSSGSVPLGLNQVSFGDGANGNTFYGKVKQLQVYKTALTDTQLAALTS